MTNNQSSIVMKKQSHKKKTYIINMKMIKIKKNKDNFGNVEN